MKTTLHTAIVSSFLLALVTAELSACPSFAEENGFDFWNMGVYQRQVETCKEERSRMQFENEVTYRRIELKEQILRELLGGRISFAEAAERFEDANRNLLSPTAYLLLFPGKTERERASLQLISFLRAGRGEKALELGDRLECDLYCGCE